MFHRFLLFSTAGSSFLNVDTDSFPELLSWPKFETSWDDFSEETFVGGPLMSANSEQKGYMQVKRIESHIGPQGKELLRQCSS